MQIDFHHTVTYVVARMAGFEHKEADIIAYAAQHVDDAADNMTIFFKNEAMYSHISSAHHTLDYKNFIKRSNHLVWIPFHFLPGNDGKPAGDNPDMDFVDKIVCKPNSYVANDMVKACISDQQSPYALHRLGITLHIFADTFAHRGFAGITNEVNQVDDLTANIIPEKSFWDRIKHSLVSIVAGIASIFLDKALPLGHASALVFPDLPYLKWSYVNHNKEKISRDNTEEFLVAANEMYKVLKKYRQNNVDINVGDLPVEVTQTMKELFSELTDEDGLERHQQWLNAIKNGRFPFEVAPLNYDKEAWKKEALGTENLINGYNNKYEYNPSFLTSNWKLFQDALQIHRFEILTEILPVYGICAA